MPRVAFFCVVCLFVSSTPAQEPAPDVTRIVREVSKKAELAANYAFEGDLGVVGQRAAGRVQSLSQARIGLAVGAAGKFMLRVNAPDKGEYLLISNGQKTWAYVPKLKQYTEEDAGALNGQAGDDDGGLRGDDERDLAEVFARLVVPLLSQLSKTTAAADTNGVADVKYENKKRRWPVLRAMSKRAADGSLSMIELAVDPESLDIGRFVWKTAMYSGAENPEKTVVNMTLDFDRFQMGGPLPDSTFEFSPPKNAKLVDTLPIPGQTGSFLLDKPAPDFELKTIRGERIHLADLRGRPVLVAFWATWCGPCRREMDALVKLHGELKDRDLVMLGINDEGKETAGKFADLNGVTFSILDDSGLKAHRLYRVRSVPSLFLIDPKGKVVGFFRGAHEYAAIRSALKAVGL